MFIACAQDSETPVTTAPAPEAQGSVETAESSEVPPQSSEAPDPEPRPSTDPKTRPGSRPAPAEANIYIDEVVVANPVIVRGRARTFENNVALRLRDARGRLLTETFTTSRGEMGTHNPFEGTLWLTRDPGDHITAEALEYSAKDGSERSLVRAERPFDVQRVNVDLYFPDKSCTGVQRFQRRVPKSISIARLMAEALVAGPVGDETANGAANPFPKGSRVQSVILRNGVLTVDYNERLQNVGGSCAAQMIRAATTETLRRLPNVQRVVITAGGSEKLALQP